MLALFLIREIMGGKLELPQAASLSFVERSDKRGDPVSQSLSEHSWQIQHHKSYSEHTNSSAACFVHRNTHVPPETF